MGVVACSGQQTLNFCAVQMFRHNQAGPTHIGEGPAAGLNSSVAECLRTLPDCSVPDYTTAALRQRCMSAVRESIAESLGAASRRSCAKAMTTKAASSSSEMIPAGSAQLPMSPVALGRPVVRVRV